MLGELDPSEIEHLLSTELVGRIGCHADGRTYVVPVTYAYSGGAVYCHSGDGLKLVLMRKNPTVCFEVERVGDLASWQSVIAWGHFEELTGASAREGMDILIKRFMPLMVSETARPTHGVGGPGAHGGGSGPLRQAVAYRIVLDEKTGRFERP